MIQGDQNTTFYHVSTLVRRKRNQIITIKNAVGDWIFEEGDIKDFIRSGFNGIYSTSHVAVARADPITSRWQASLSEVERDNISEGGGLMRKKLRQPYGP